MPQAAHHAVLLSRPRRVRRTSVVLGLLGLVAVAVAVLVLGLAGSVDSAPSSIVSDQSVTRSDGGPDEAAVAAAVGSRAGAVSSEGAVAAAIGAATPRETARPDESRVAAAVSAGAPGRP